MCGPALSRDGRRVAFATWIGGKNVVVVDGRQGEPFDSVSWPLSLSDDGGVVAYAARLGSDQFCVAGGRRSAAYPSVAFPALSADGRVAAFAAFDGSKWFAVVDGVAGPAFAWVGHLSLHPSGTPLAYVAERRNSEGRLVSFVVCDDRGGPSFDHVTRPVISRDGQRVAYGGRRNGRWALVVDGRETPTEDEISCVFLSGDGRRAGYVVERPGETWVVGPRGRGPTFEWVGWPAFLPDGRVVHLAARGRTKFLVVGGQTVELGGGVVWDPVLSPDGSRVGFGTKVGRGLFWKVLTLPKDALEETRP